MWFEKGGALGALDLCGRGIGSAARSSPDLSVDVEILVCKAGSSRCRGCREILHFGVWWWGCHIARPRNNNVVVYVGTVESLGACQRLIKVTSGEFRKASNRSAMLVE